MTLRTLVLHTTLTTAVIFLGCREAPLAPAFPELPAGAESLTPPASYANWWRDTEQCAGMSGDMSRITWFVVPGRTSFVYQDGKYDGYWWNGVHWIILAGDKVSDSLIVRHEMLHELLGRGDHPPAYFQQKCAAVVVCNDMCRSGN